MSRSTCLVTGGAGFIGCAASSMLADRFEHVVAIDSLHPQVHPNRKRPKHLDRRVELIVGDVTQPRTWDSVLVNVSPTVVLHLAAETGTGQSLFKASRHTHVNVTGTAQMLDAFAQHKRIPERILLTSSRAVYGEGAWRNPQTGTIEYPRQRTRVQLERGQWDFGQLEPLPLSAETIEPRPNSVYGVTKLAQEQILTAWAVAVGVTPIVLRLQNVYGAGQSLYNAYTGICPLFARLARERKSIPLFEDGQIVRDFIYVDDVIAALGAALSHAPAPHAYDIGSGAATTLTELANTIAHHYNAPSPHVTGSFRHGDVRYAACSIEAARRHLDWQPTIQLSEGIQKLCDWIDGEIPSSHAQESVA